MPPTNPADSLRTAPIEELAVLLLKQFKRLLSERDLTLTTPEIEAFGAAMAAHTAPMQAAAMRAALQQIVQESLTELQTRFGLTFEASLAADMNSIGGWQTTAEFLEVANHKSNAELRISAGSSLLVMMGAIDYADYLWQVIADDDGVWDVDASFALRALCHIAQVSPQAVDWEQQVRAFLDAQA